MDAIAASAVARRLHSGQVTRTGEPLIEHVERVAGAVPPEARALACLHDVLERANPSSEELRELDLSDAEWRVLALLTRGSRESYKLYISRIARAGGKAGAIARTIKLADLDDHLRHRQPRARTPDYSWARRTIVASQEARGEAGGGRASRTRNAA